MLKKEDYDAKITEIKDKLGDNFALISNIIADLSTDYDSVIVDKDNYEKQITDLKAEKVKLLETNNDLFSKITNHNPATKDPAIEKKQKENEKPNINDIINENGGLE